MSSAARTVENHARDGNLRIELLAPQHQCGDGSRGFGAIDGEDHGRLQQLGEFGRAVSAQRVHAVEQPTVTLDQSHAISRSGEGSLYRIGRHEEQIEVTAWFCGGDGEPGRVDIVGAFFERRHVEPLLTPSGGET